MRIGKEIISGNSGCYIVCKADAFGIKKKNEIIVLFILQRDNLMRQKPRED
jgi:hypothetical protein